MYLEYLHKWTLDEFVGTRVGSMKSENIDMFFISDSNLKRPEAKQTQSRKMRAKAGQA